LHLFAENIIPNLLDIWTGRFKDLDEGCESYVLDNNVWSAIGAETLAAVKEIPSAFVRKMGNIAEDRSGYTAESYAFWFMYLAPHLLAGRFKHRKYYDHAMELVAIMKVTLQYSLTHQEINWLENACDSWVHKYEEYYYQYEDSRLAFCVLTIHGLLHVAPDICVCGPMSATWSWYMERYCGFLKKALLSRKQPWQNLDERVKQFSNLAHLRMKYDLSTELPMERHSSDNVRAGEHVYEECELI
ncbi:uncharacterized protein PHACADRAFT_60508, partial [Phanerochaete carnosa HHB-10118-sp]